MGWAVVGGAGHCEWDRPLWVGQAIVGGVGHCR